MEVGKGVEGAADVPRVLNGATLAPRSTSTSISKEISLMAKKKATRKATRKAAKKTGKKKAGARKKA